MRKKSDRRMELYNPYKLQIKNQTTLMTAKEVSRDGKVNKEVEQEQKVNQPDEELLEVENQSKIQESRWLKGQPIIMQKRWQDNAKTEKKKDSL